MIKKGDGMAGLTKEHPRYNVVSTRLSDEERETTAECMALAKKSQTDYVREAIMEKNERERSKGHEMPQV